MADVSGVNGASGTGAVVSSGGMQFVSPDSLLEFFRAQLGDFDSQITTQMKAQNTQLQEREAVQNVETVLESFGTSGPTGADGASQMQTCWDAFTQAMNSLPPGDPVISQLAAQQQLLNSQYGFTPKVDAGTTMNNLVMQQGTPASMSKGPQNEDWKGTTGAVSNIDQNIKSNADIQMLQLQDLVSQRQQITELVTGITTKADQSLEDQAKAVGN